MGWPLAIFAIYVVKEASSLITNLAGKDKFTKEGELKQKLLEDKRLDNLSEEVAEKIKDQLGDRSSLKERLEEIKGLSKAERAELFRDFKNDNLLEQKAINKELQDRLDKSEQRSIQLAQEFQKARKNKDPAKMAQVDQIIKDNDKEMHTIRLDMKKQGQEAKEKVQAIEEYFKKVEQNKPWYLDPSFKSPWLWAMLLISCAIFYYSYQGLVWAWQQIKPFIWKDNQ